MNYFTKKFKIATVVFLFASPMSSIFAQMESQLCSSKGYTIETINGVFTGKNGAILNRDSLEIFLSDAYNGEPLTIDFLLNPSHIGGIGDILMSAYQKAFENETVKGYDLIEMLNDASAKVKTQKLLLVAHSQGNFYANSFYDTVADNVGGVPAKSIGIYSIATPADRIAGGGKWLTSDTDKVISTFVASVPFKKIMPPNIHIELQSGDDFTGHGFNEVYLKYSAPQIVVDIYASLDKLSSDFERREDILCIDPPKLSLVHKTQGIVLSIADPIATVGVKTVATTAKVGIFVGIATVNAGVAATVWAYNTGVAVAVWTYNMSIATLKAVANVAVAVASIVYTSVASLTSDTESVAISTTAVMNNIVVDSSKMVAGPIYAVVDQKTTEQLQPVSDSPTLLPQTQSSTVLQSGKTEIQKTTPLKLVFIGNQSPDSLGSGGGASPRVLGSMSETLPEEEVEETAGVTLSAPTLSAPQCAQTLATDGCLLATTTVHVEWLKIPDASFYTINKNGTYATTTSPAHDIIAKDFSDYTFEVSVMGRDGSTSATSTLKVSVASIPIAINEIAWRGTSASSNDEWIELKNNTGHTIDLTQWVLEATDTKPFIKLTGNILPHEYRILERNDDAVVANISAGQIYGNNGSTWALINKGEELVLSYASSTMDATPRGDWAEDFYSGSSRKTVERISAKELGSSPTNWATWGSTVDFIKNGEDNNGDDISGTPGSRNSVNFQSLNNGEDVTSDLTLSPDIGYFTAKTILVSASSTLTIPEGVDISLYQGSLRLNGVFMAKGTAENPVVFNTFSDTQTSNKLWFKDTMGTSTLNHVVIENTGGILLENSDMEIRNANFVNNEAGLELYNSTAVIENTHFASTTEEVIEAYDGSTILVASSTITDTLDADAIGIYDSTLTIAGTTIDHVHDGDAIGAYDSVVSIASSTIKNIDDGDAVALYNSTSTITNTTIQNGSGDGVAIYGGTATIDSSTISGFTEGAGVLVADPVAPVAITNTVITGNNVGIEAYPDEAFVVL